MFPRNRTGQARKAWRARLTERLVLTERHFLHAAGLPGEPGGPNRVFYKHVLHAPDLNLGYKASVFPGLTLAIEARNWTLAAAQAAIIEERVLGAAKFLATGEEPAADRAWDFFANLLIIAGLLALVVGGMVLTVRCAAARAARAPHISAEAERAAAAVAAAAAAQATAQGSVGGGAWDDAAARNAVHAIRTYHGAAGAEPAWSRV